jgi:hypothetical protein
MDPGTKMGLGRPKIQSSHNRFKTEVCVGLIIMNSTQLERDQTDTVCEIYCDIFVLPNKQNFVDYIVCTMLTW